MAEFGEDSWRSFLPVDGWAVDGDVLAALNRLPEPHRQKKRATVLGLVAAEAGGEVGGECLW